MKGTLLTVTTVVAGSLVGLAVGQLLPPGTQSMALSGLGLVTLGLGIKMFLGSRNIMILAGSVAIGGIIGLLCGIQNGLDFLANSLKQFLGGGQSFSEGFVTATVLYCVGPMTFLGCIQDGIEGKSELLKLKATLDGVASIFLAASLGYGVLVSAFSVLLIQGTITLFAAKLSWLKEDEEILAELTGAGGPIMLATGLSLLEIKKIPTANFLPALLISPAILTLSRKLQSKRNQTA
jgi:uncharacterized membrane protein YqgA involved in biofilm formation